MYKEQKKCYTRKHKDNLQYLSSYEKLNCLCSRWPELAFRLDEEVVMTAAVPLNVEVKHSFVVENFTARTHQRRQPEWCSKEWSTSRATDMKYWRQVSHSLRKLTASMGQYPTS